MPQGSHPWDEEWLVVERLGKGGQGLTDLVTRKSEPAQTAALKILKNNRDSQARGRMYREVASLEVLASAGGSVPSILDHNTQHYKDPSVELFVVMEYISGGELREVVDADGPLSIDVATQIVLNICKTIELAHTYPILHRDLKPENIIAREIASGDVVIIDYGLSFNADDPDVTVTGETFRNQFLDLPETNTPGGNRRDPRSDVTAACAIFYYLLTGNAVGQLQGGDGRLPHMRSGYSIRECVGDSPTVGQLEMLFNRGFAPNVDNRFQSVAEFRDRLIHATSTSTVNVPEDPILVAERASEVLRKGDRKTQIQEFIEPAGNVMKSIQRFANGFVNRLGRFALVVAQDAALGQHLPQGLDRVLTYQTKLQINPNHHNHLRIIVFAVASRAEQCVILRQFYERSSGQKITSTDEGWHELLWYDVSTTPTLEVVHDDIRAWMNKSMQELTGLVVAQ
ncbi:serine/threonine protein kinase [Candidatus Hydrogenedentota bacterium]